MSCSPRAELIADQWREAELPGTDGLVADGVAALQQKFGHVPQPELVAEPSEHSEQHDVRQQLEIVEERPLRSLKRRWQFTHENRR